MLLKIAMPAAMFSGVGYYGGTYATSTDDINAYEQRMETADGYLANGDYGKAIAGFMQASDQYGGSYCQTQRMELISYSSHFHTSHHI